jgi:hypothetical protein
VLRVAGRHGDDACVDRHELAFRPLRTAAAGAADAEGDLIATAPVVARPAEDVTGHCEQDGIVEAASGQALQP